MSISISSVGSYVPADSLSAGVFVLVPFGRMAWSLAMVTGNRSSRGRVEYVKLCSGWQPSNRCYAKLGDEILACNDDEVRRRSRLSVSQLRSDVTAVVTKQDDEADRIAAEWAAEDLEAGDEVFYSHYGYLRAGIFHRYTFGSTGKRTGFVLALCTRGKLERSPAFKLSSYRGRVTKLRPASEYHRRQLAEIRAAIALSKE